MAADEVGSCGAESREALIDATAVETVCAGFANLSAAGVTARAGLPASSFSAHFADIGAAVSAAHDALVEEFVGWLLQVCETQQSWPLKVKVGIGATLDLAAASPVRARFLLIDHLTSDPELVRQGTEARDRFARLLAAGRPGFPDATALPAITEQALVAGIAGTISARLLLGEAELLPSLAPQLVELTLLPYLGREGAAAVARRPRPR
jgi:AcrR family transcriptional regulator